MDTKTFYGIKNNVRALLEEYNSDDENLSDDNDFIKKKDDLMTTY